MKTCVHCGVAFVKTSVPCQGHPNSVKVSETWPQYLVCMVLHYADRCPTCGGDVYEDVYVRPTFKDGMVTAEVDDEGSVWLTGPTILSRECAQRFARWILAR